MPITTDQLRRYAIARSLFPPTTLPKAIAKLGFVQADPIRAPARAQDLILRHRVAGYRAGDIDRRYARLGIEEDFFVNYGFMPRATHALMHPRTARTTWTPARQAQADAVLDFVRARGTVHPRDVDAAFDHGKVTNWFGGRSNASTQLLDAMHYRGLVRIAGRDGGVRLYAARAGHAAAGPGAAPLDPAAGPGAGPLDPAAGTGAAPLHPAAGTGAAPLHPAAGTGAGPPDAATGTAAARLDAAAAADAAYDALVDIVVGLYAPLPLRTLSERVLGLRVAVPQWGDRRTAALKRARERLPHAAVDGTTWYWPVGENPASRRHRVDPGAVRLLAPFDPVVWDRRRFEIFWGWAYRFEAYVPAPQRVRGYYALPLLAGEDVVGWANLKLAGGRLSAEVGYVDGWRPRGAAHRRALDGEVAAIEDFLKPAAAPTPAARPAPAARR